MPTGANWGGKSSAGPPFGEAGLFTTGTRLEYDSKPTVNASNKKGLFFFKKAINVMHDYLRQNFKKKYYCV